jgi:hypothetical protein
MYSFWYFLHCLNILVKSNEWLSPDTSSSIFVSVKMRECADFYRCLPELNAKADLMMFVKIFYTISQVKAEQTQYGIYIVTLHMYTGHRQ